MTVQGSIENVLADPMGFMNSALIDPMGFVAAYFLIILVVGIIGVVIEFILAVLTYKNADKRQIKSAIIWAFIVFCFSFLGVLVYLLFRRQE